MDRLQAALNQHDLEPFIKCFDPDYQSEQPVHPDRGFAGREQVHKNWSAIFRSTPDFRSELIRVTYEGDTVWAEWHWFGTRTDRTQLDLRGVTIIGIRNAQIHWMRLYMEAVQDGGAGIDAKGRMRRGNLPANPWPAIKPGCHCENCAIIEHILLPILRWTFHTAFWRDRHAAHDYIHLASRH
jgi:hypothetical protein